MSEFLADRLYRIGKASQRLGISIPMVRNWIYSGKIITLRTVGGEHRIPESEIRRILGVSSEERKTVIYSRVSSQGQKSDLATQEQLLEHYAIKKGYSNIVELKDIASGLNGKRCGLNKLFQMVSNNEVDLVIVNYKDRLRRFGFHYLETYFKAHGTRIIVLNEDEVQDPQKELVDDLIAILTSFSGKIYGLRSHKAIHIVNTLKTEMKA
ncbi:MAG: IS607 family transposase [Promethearchaeota archaeon]